MPGKTLVDRFVITLEPISGADSKKSVATLWDTIVFPLSSPGPSPEMTVTKGMSTNGGPSCYETYILSGVCDPDHWPLPSKWRDIVEAAFESLAAKANVTMHYEEVRWVGRK